MELSTITVLGHLSAAMLAGALIGVERTFNGRPAGFRTHVLVCTASSLLMLLGTREAAALSGLPIDAIRIDPARMAQGIMTGIGFLGAGVIMKDGFSVRGLTTAASIWVTAAIGIIIGFGFYVPAATATALTLITLSLFRWLERIVPTLVFARLVVRAARDSALTEDALREMIERDGIGAGQVAYRMNGEGKYLEYEMTIRSRHASNFRALAQRLAQTPAILEFSLATSGEK
ncbi:MAG: MgtC/SapB family protein [Sulfurifustaceae bacterium]